LDNAESGHYTAVGIVKSLKVFIDKNGKEMAFGTLYNIQWEIDYICFSHIWKKCKKMIVENNKVILNGKLKKTNKYSNKSNFIVSSVWNIK
jgi:DNA polymerase III alpha subunit